MDIKQYIDYFEEIAHLDRSEQFKLIEQASQRVHQRFKLPILTLLPITLRVLFLLLFCGGSYLLFGYALWLVLGSALAALIVSKVFITETKDKLLLQELKHLL